MCIRGVISIKARLDQYFANDFANDNANDAANDFIAGHENRLSGNF